MNQVAEEAIRTEVADGQWPASHWARSVTIDPFFNGVSLKCIAIQRHYSMISPVSTQLYSSGKWCVVIVLWWAEELNMLYQKNLEEKRIFLKNQVFSAPYWPC